MSEELEAEFHGLRQLTTTITLDGVEVADIANALGWYLDSYIPLGDLEWRARIDELWRRVLNASEEQNPVKPITLEDLS